MIRSNVNYECFKTIKSIFKPMFNKEKNFRT